MRGTSACIENPPGLLAIALHGPGRFGTQTPDGSKGGMCTPSCEHVCMSMHAISELLHCRARAPIVRKSRHALQKSRRGRCVKEPAPCADTILVESSTGSSDEEKDCNPDYHEGILSYSVLRDGEAYCEREHHRALIVP